MKRCLITMLVLLAVGVTAGDTVAIKSMHVEIATTDDAGKQTYVEAPDALERLDGEDDSWLRVALPDPAPLKPWCQHVGLILTLDTPIPAGTPWRVTGRARSVSGAKGLSILRRWGSSKPWNDHVALTDTWQAFSVERITADHETEFIAISLVARPERRLQPCAEGTFDIADLKIELLPQPPADKP